MKCFLTISDFTGLAFLDLKNNPQHKELINQYEVKCLRDLLGSYLFGIVQNAMTLNETTQKYEIVQADFPEEHALVYGITYENVIGKVVNYEGILDYLKLGIHSLYIKDNQFNTTMGNIAYKTVGEAEKPDKEALTAERIKKTLLAVDWFCEICDYIRYRNVELYGDSGQYVFFAPKKLDLK